VPAWCWRCDPATKAIREALEKKEQERTDKPVIVEG
jgi:hypothetical protein